MSSESSEAATFTSKSFDYVVIGGGIGGLTIAARSVDFTHDLEDVVETVHQSL